MSTTFVTAHLEPETRIVASAAVTQIQLKIYRPDAHQITIFGSVEAMCRVRDALLAALPLEPAVAS